jgi:hypothetical protein
MFATSPLHSLHAVLTHPNNQVQLSTTHAISITLPTGIVASPSSAAASKILALIEDEEGRYQTSLNDTYHEMGEKTFKGLRRALPLTRQKLDWDKVCLDALFGVCIDFFFVTGSWL